MGVLTKKIGLSISISTIILSGCGDGQKRDDILAADQEFVENITRYARVDGELYQYRNNNGKNVTGARQPVGEAVKEDDYKLIDGDIVRRSDFWGVAQSEHGLGACTSTVIGPKTVLTAAHCVDGGGVPAKADQLNMRLWQFESLDRNYTFDCMINDSYANAPDQGDGASRAPRNTHDVALCHLNNYDRITLEGVANFYENVDVNTRVMDKKYDGIGDKLLLVGLGCSKTKIVQRDGGFEITNNSSDGRLRVGNAIVIVNYDIVTGEAYHGLLESRSDLNDEFSDLCPGDSVGPAFYKINDDSFNDARKIVAVNSAVGPISQTKLSSSFAQLRSPPVKRLFSKFVSENNAVICGYDGVLPGTNGCRE